MRLKFYLSFHMSISCITGPLVIDLYPLLYVYFRMVIFDV